MKIAIFAEQDPRLSRSYLNSSNVLLGETGLNFGNLAFWFGASGLTKENLHFFGWNSKADSIADCDAIMIPAANWLSNTTDFGFLADIIESVDKPVLVLGLGIQSSGAANTIRLREGTLRFVKSAAARSPHLLVRGALTKNFLRDLGVENVEVGGCPSLFINPRLDLGERLRRKIDQLEFRRNMKMAVHGLNLGHPELRRIERILFALTVQHDAEYIIQSPLSAVKALLNDELMESDTASLTALNKFVAPNLNLDQFIFEIRKRAVFYNNISSWLLRLRQMGCSINTRIHGALLSVAAETPSVCIYHDVRTQELSEATGIPSIGTAELQDWDMDIVELFERSPFDSAAFNNNRAVKAKLLCTTMESLGIEPSDNVLTISRSL